MSFVPSRRQPRRIALRTIGLAAGAFAVAGLLAWSPSPTTGWNQGSAEATLWQLLNGARANNGMAPLQQDGTLVSLARWRSQDMIQRDYFDHTILGSGCQVYCYYDSNGLSYVWAGENIGWNSGLADDYSPVRVHEKFMESAGHRANVLNAAFTHGGVGAFAADNVSFQGYVQNPRMYTELFLQAPSAAPPPPVYQPPPAPVYQPPPPSGGGGGGGGYVAPAPAAQVAAPAEAEPEPEPETMSVATPARPSPTAGIDGVASFLLKGTWDELVTVRLAMDDALGVASDEGDASDFQLATAPTQQRVEGAGAVDRGFVETVLGSLLAFFFG